MADEEQKLGTSVTYVDPSEKKKPIKVQGISFEPGKAVELTELLPQEQAEKLAKRLSVNQHFKVEGGPDHGETLEQLEANRFKHEQDVQQAFRRNQERRKPKEADEVVEPEPPEGYVAPDAPTLEGNAPRVAPDEALPPRSSRRK